MRKPGGYSIITEPGVPDREADTFTCRHCNRVTFVKPFMAAEDMGGRCTCCGGLICTRCVGQGCTPMEKRLEAAERRYEARRSYDDCVQ